MTWGIAFIPMSVVIIAIVYSLIRKDRTNKEIQIKRGAIMKSKDKVKIKKTAKTNSKKNEESEPRKSPSLITASPENLVRPMTRNIKEIPKNELEWMYQKERAFTFYGRRCQECGSTENLVVHHVIKRKMGVNDALENLEVLCQSCHDHLHGYDTKFKGKPLDECLVTSKKMLILNKALSEKKTVEFDYVGSGGKKSHRFVQPSTCEFKKPGELDFVRAKYSPERIAEFNNQEPRQYFRGFCYTSRKRKMFRVAGMSNLTIKDKKQLTDTETPSS